MHGQNGLSFVVSRMTLMASFCTLLNFSRLDCVRVCETQNMVNDTEYHTLMQQERMTLFDAFWSHGFQHGQYFVAPEFS